jgi:WD40 repeat protein
VWDAANGQLIGKLSGFQGDQPTHAAFSPDSKRIITFGPSVTAVLWNAETGQLMTHLDAAVKSAAFSPDSQRIVTVDKVQTANVYNARTGQLLTKLGSDGINDAAFSPDGQRIVTAAADSIARIYRVVTLSDIAELLGK